MKTWQPKLEAAAIRMVVSGHHDHPPKGGEAELKNVDDAMIIQNIYGVVGYGRNRAIQQSKGKYLCFFDAVRIIIMEYSVKRSHNIFAVVRTT